ALIFDRGLRFFFQAEDGIRDRNVTGVQTCALPISGFEVRTTEAGSYIFPKINNLSIHCDDFVKVLKKQAKVTVTPGTQFGPQFTDCIRLNFSQDKEKAVDAVKRIIKVAGYYKNEK